MDPLRLPAQNPGSYQPLRDSLEVLCFLIFYYFPFQPSFSFFFVIFLLDCFCLFIIIADRGCEWTPPASRRKNRGPLRHFDILFWSLTSSFSAFISFKFSFSLSGTKSTNFLAMKFTT